MKSKNISTAILLAAIISGSAANIFACGPSFPNNLLDAGDGAVLQPPIGDFEQELELMKLPAPKVHAIQLLDRQQYYEQSADVEMTDLAAALKREKVSSEQATAILQAHLAERMKLNLYLAKEREWSSDSQWIPDSNGVMQLTGPTNPPPPFPDIAVTPGLPREFALYFEGAIAWHKNEDWQTCQSWQDLLDLPAAQRHFKSTWAAFMLARYHQDETNNTDDDLAMTYFEQVRTLAKNGFADSAGLAVASIGGEAKIYLNRKDYKHAIELYLEQYAAGDDSAPDSLHSAAAAALHQDGATETQLLSLAENSRTRRVITAWLISRHPYNDRSEAANDPDAKNFFDGTDEWLAAVESAGVKDMESAEQLALAAYQAGDMDAARRWAARSAKSPVSQWLQAKLLMRDGKIDEAAKRLAKLSRMFPQDLSDTNAPGNFAQSLFVDTNPEWHETIPIGRQTLGELGVLQLTRREYTEALDALLRSGYWMDAAYVGERVLTVDELKNYVDRHWPAAKSATGTQSRRELDDADWAAANPGDAIRYLLARRITRATGGREALAYFPPDYAADYECYLDWLHSGQDEALQPDKRAENMFAAAVMTRTNGMELFGTELEPDWAIYGGNYELGNIWQARSNDMAVAKINMAAPDEIARASSRLTEPDERFHYRWQAAALAWEAAQMMPDNSDDTARVLCTAGTWLKDHDAPVADKFYKALVRRCRKTAVGAQADVLRWFPAQDVSGGRPRLETIAITPELTNAVSGDSTNLCSQEFPVPGRRYAVHEDEDVYIIARAVQRLGVPMRVNDILQANPGLKRGPIEFETEIMIPETSDGATNAPQ